MAKKKETDKYVEIPLVIFVMGLFMAIFTGDINVLFVAIPLAAFTEFAIIMILAKLDR